MGEKWVCENCGYETKWTAEDHAEKGNPVCPDCDVDLVYQEGEIMQPGDAPENGIKLVGHVGVDSGQVIITDPCYLKGFDNKDFDEKEVEEMKKSGKFKYSYSGACARTLSPSQAGEIGLGEQGVVSCSGFGDGEYPVYAEFESGRVKALRIVFF